MRLESPQPIARWWRGKVSLKGDCVVPGKRRPYDPFTHYYPAGFRTRKREETRSLPYRFLDVDGNNPRAVSEFCEKYGVLGLSDWKGWSEYGKEVQQAVEPSPFQRLSAPPEARAMRDLLFGAPPLSVLARPMTLSKFKTAQRQLQETIDWMKESEKGATPKIRLAAQHKVELRFSEKLSLVRPAVVWDSKEKKMMTSWHALSLESLLYLMLLYDCQGRGRVLVCPWCKKAFVKDSPKVKWCSPQCGISARVAKCRAKQRKLNKDKE